MKTNRNQNSGTQGWKNKMAATAAIAAFSAVGYLAGSHWNLDESPATPAKDPAVAAADTASLSSASNAAGGRAASVVATAGNRQTQHTSSAPLLMKLKGSPSGGPLPVAGLNPDADKGRVAKLDLSKLRGWSGLQQGSPILLPGIEGDALEATVNLIQQDGAWMRMGGDLAHGKGTFSLNTNFSEVSGMIMMPDTQTGLQILMDGPELVMVERRLSALLCFPAVKEQPNSAAGDNVARNATAVAQVPPVINTRPGARGVIFVDFDGETVTDPVWNGGRTINAAPSAMTSDQITQSIAIAAQDWAPFDVTLTTDAALYASTAPGLRMHVVVTPTDSAAPGSGGVAYVDSWSGAGRGFKSDVVCWVFNQSIKTVAEAISHEVGHTVGLNHDGQDGGIEYYSGHGGGLTTATSWGPIMGSAYSRSLVQWSKGEYAKANNFEDDLAIIGKAANQFGLVKTDLPNGVKPLPVSGSTFQTEGLLRGATSVDTYNFSSAGGPFSATARPAATDSDVDVQLELKTSAGATVVVSDLPDALSATINKTLTAGDYSLVVRPAGTGSAPAGGYTTGYSSYGSIGKYSLSGSVTAAIALPVFTSPTTVQGMVNSPMNFTVGVSAGSTVSVKTSSLPSGLSFNPATLVLSGTPTRETGTGTPGSADGPGLLQLVATNASGSATTTIVISISQAGLPLSEAFLGNTPTTTAAAPWTGVRVLRADGSLGTVAQSGAVANSASSTASFTYNPSTGNQKSGAWSVVTFYWKASTEAAGSTANKGDMVQCRVDGALRRDANTGGPLVLSGETGWVKQTLRIEGNGSKRIDFVYSKDASLSAGQDRVWVYVDSIGQPPVVTKSPTSLRLPKGSTTFTLAGEVSGATSLVWKKDFAVLADGKSASGSTIAGATSGTLTVSDISGADVGVYWLEARNAFGAVITRPVEVAILAPPVITQQPVAPMGLKVGDPLTLSATVSGGVPMYYRWIKDGAATRWSVTASSTISLTIPKTTAASAGKYSLIVLNDLDVVTSETVNVTLNPSAAASTKSPTR